MVNVDGLTNNIISCLRKDYADVVISTTQINTVGNLFPKVKDPVPPDDRSNIVYCISCAAEGCPACYVGMSSNKLRTRKSGHRTNINSLNELLKKGEDINDQAIMKLRETTALIEHSATSHHSFDLDGAKILDSTTKTQNLDVLEVCHITNTPHTVNKREDTNKLSSAYASVLQTVKLALSKQTLTQHTNRPSVGNFSIV